MFRAMSSIFLDKNTPIDVAWYSQGALVALSNATVAKDFGFSIRNAFLLETPWVKDFAKKDHLEKLDQVLI